VVEQFRHDKCFFCLSATRFTRTRHIEDIQKVVKLFQRRGLPAVRVHRRSSRTRGRIQPPEPRVDFTVTIDPRRRIDVRFVGIDPDSIGDEQLREH